MTSRINFADIEDQREFELLPRGRYHVRVNDLGEREAGDNAKNPGARMLNWEFEVVGDKSDDNPYGGQKVWDQQICVQSSLWKVKAFLKATGKVDTSLLSFDSAEKEFYYTDDDGDEAVLDMNDFIDTEMEIQVGINPANKGKDGTEYSARNKVNNFYEIEDNDSSLIP